MDYITGTVQLKTWLSLDSNNEKQEKFQIILKFHKKGIYTVVLKLFYLISLKRNFKNTSKLKNLL